MKLDFKLNWNQLSELGLIEKINKEIMHPLGLAVYREVESGNSGGCIVSANGPFQYSPDKVFKNYSDSEIKTMILKMKADSEGKAK